MTLQFDVSFPKSSEDHRLQLVKINESIFAILYAPLESEGPITLDCPDWSLILLESINSRTEVSISAINIISFSDVASREGLVSVHASKKLVTVGPPLTSSDTVHIIADEVVQLDGDEAVLKLFTDAVMNARDLNPTTFLQAKKSMLAALCLIAEKIEGSLSLDKVFKIWEIE